MVNVRLYESVKRLYGKNTEQSIAARLKISRSSIQRRCWVVKMSKEIPIIEVWYLEGKLNDTQLQSLHYAFNKGRLKEEWAFIKEGGISTEYYSRRAVGEIRRAIQATKDKRVKQALEWVLKLKETLQ